MPFSGQGAATNAHFWVKMDHDGRLVPGQGNPPGNCLMGHITSQSMGKPDLGPFMPSPATYLVQWGSENGYFWPPPVLKMAPGEGENGLKPPSPMYKEVNCTFRV